jgi:hypothetical protein
VVVVRQVGLLFQISLDLDRGLDFFEYVSVWFFTCIWLCSCFMPLFFMLIECEHSHICSDCVLVGLGARRSFPLSQHVLGDIDESRLQSELVMRNTFSVEGVFLAKSQYA